VCARARVRMRCIKNRLLSCISKNRRVPHGLRGSGQFLRVLQYSYIPFLSRRSGLEEGGSYVRSYTPHTYNYSLGLESCFKSDLVPSTPSAQDERERSPAAVKSSVVHSHLTRLAHETPLTRSTGSRAARARAAPRDTRLPS